MYRSVRTRGEVRKGLHPIWKFRIELVRAQSDFLLGILNNSYNGAPVQALVLHLKSLKLVLENKFSSTSNSHFMRVPIIAIIEFLGITVAYFYNAGSYIPFRINHRIGKMATAS